MNKEVKHLVVEIFTGKDSSVPITVNYICKVRNNAYLLLKSFPVIGITCEECKKEIEMRK